MKHNFNYHKNFPLENGSIIPDLKIAYSTFGSLNEKKDNVIWVCHALTANSNVFEWWPGLFGENDLYNPKDYFIICANNLGSCYGTSGPLCINSFTNEPWFDYFPNITIKDIVSSFNLLKTHLEITKIHTLIGGSQGGQIALEWALQEPTLTENLILIATNAVHSPWGIAFNESQRLAIKADRTYYSNVADAAQKGLSAARSIALLSYRGYESYSSSQKENNPEKKENFPAASYQRYQGQKLVNRFNAYSYVRLLDAMDSHNIARNRTLSPEEALQTIVAKTLVISINSDLLFPPNEQAYLAKHIPNASYEIIESSYGHDGFLLETEKLSKTIEQFYSSKKTKKYSLQLI